MSQSCRKALDVTLAKTSHLRAKDKSTAAKSATSGPEPSGQIRDMSQHFNRHAVKLAVLAWLWEVSSMPATARAKEPPRESLPLEERIRRRAYELYVQRGSQPGSELDDWLQAEAEIRRAQDQVVDEASRESFPASDPPPY